VRRSTELVADDVWLLAWGGPIGVFNAYLVGDVLVDAGFRQTRHWLLRQLRGRQVGAHALSHVHPDHQGSSAHVCRCLHLPLWCGAGDAEAMESGRSNYLPQRRLPRLFARSVGGGGHHVSRRLHEGDDLAAGFVVLETPGHSPGHLSFWRERDRTLLAGEVLLNFGVLTEPLPPFTTDVAENRASLRRLAALDPALVLFAHGRPLHEPARLKSFAARFPQQA
jgi:glyoxylase-like metal-dependent hydrolase (beta-lactamase superfamily II)